MSAPELQWRNNDPTENIQVDFTDADGNPQVLSFVATPPHWLAEPVIYGDLFAAPLDKIFDGEADPISPGSSDEAQLLKLFRESVLATVKDVDRCRRLHSGKSHAPRMNGDDARDLSLVWFLDALESRSKRYAR